MSVCEKCNGTGEVEQPVSLSEMGKVKCDFCEGTGRIDDGAEGYEIGEAVIQRLDRIIELLEDLANSGGKRQ